MAALILLLPLLALLQTAPSVARPHKCSRVWPTKAQSAGLGGSGGGLGAAQPADMRVLAKLNDHVLTTSAAQHLVALRVAEDASEKRYAEAAGRPEIELGGVQVVATFAGEAATVALGNSCGKGATIVRAPEVSIGTFMGDAGAALEHGAPLPASCEVVFHPADGFSGEAVLVYENAGEESNETAAAALVVQVVPCNTDPIAADDHVKGMSGRVIRIDVLRNDADADDEDGASWACTDPATKVADDFGAKTAKPEIVTFTNVAHDLGLRAEQCEVRTSPNCLFDQYDSQLNKWDEGGFCMQETLTGGGCVGDADGDGLDDIFYPRMDGADILYRNRGDGTFEDISSDAGLARFLHVHSNGCSFIDIDNDGDNDVYVSTVADAQFMLYVNDGTGKFTEEAKKRGVDNIPGVARFRGHKTAGGSIDVADFDLDGYLDIVTTEWLPHLGKGEMNDASGFDKWHNRKGGNNARIYHNRGAAQPGFFDDVTQKVGMRNYPPGQGSTASGAMMADRRYDYGSNSEIWDALDCLEPPRLADALPGGSRRMIGNGGSAGVDGDSTKGSSAASVADTTQDGKVVIKADTNVRCHPLDLSCVENRTALKTRYTRAVNNILGRDPDHVFFGMRHPLVGTWRGSAGKTGWENVHSHVLVVHANWTWDLVDTIQTAGEPDFVTFVESGGLWKADDHVDYVAFFKETYRRVYQESSLDGSKTPIQNLEDLDALKSAERSDAELDDRDYYNGGRYWAGHGDWVKVDCFGMTAWHQVRGVLLLLFVLFIFISRIPKRSHHWFPPAPIHLSSFL